MLFFVGFVCLFSVNKQQIPGYCLKDLVNDKFRAVWSWSWQAEKTYLPTKHSFSFVDQTVEQTVQNPMTAVFREDITRTL